MCATCPTSRLSSSSRRKLLQEAQRRGLRVPTTRQYSRNAREDLADFVEATAAFTLDPWQRVLCERLQRLRHERGQRLLIHAPPQWGKSVIVSQRFPAYLLGHRPDLRVKLACYNVTHASRFGQIVRDVMQSSEYRALFPEPDRRLPEVAARAEWSTAARTALADAQPSFMALGLLTGFVGQGADTLIIDDPYSSPQDAASALIRESVWTFWTASAKVRLNDDTNVVVMFHRYHEDDLAGRLWAEGGWEMLRFAAIADGDPEMPDPMGREVGERLSPRMSDGYLETQQQNQSVWQGQFQGRPAPREGAFFRTAQLQWVDAAPVGLRLVRAWDMAATAGDGAYTAGVLMGVDPEGRYYVLDVTRGQWATDHRDREIKSTAELDGRGVPIHGPQDPGAAGVEAAAAFRRKLAGWPVWTTRVSGDKVTRADPFSAQLNGGNVYLVRGAWNKAFTEELAVFPVGTYKDQVDAAADAFNYLSRPPRKMGFSI